MDKFSKVLRISYYIFSLMTAYDTALVIACLTYGSTMATFGNHTLAIITAAIITLAILWVIEVVSTVGMLPTLEAFQKGGVKQVKKGYYIVLFYLVLLSVASLSVSIFGRDYIAEVVVPIPAMINDAEPIASIEASANATTAQLQGIIKTAQAERKKAIANASNAKLDALANAGNEWATVTRNKLIEKAAAPYSTQIAAANAQLSEAMASTQSAISGKRIEISTANAAALQSAERQRHLISTFLMWLSIVATCMMWITTITIVIWDAADGQLDGSIGTPPPTRPTDDEDDDDDDNGEPRNDIPHHHRKRKPTPKVVYMDNEVNPLYEELNNEKSLVITRGTDDGGTYFMTRDFKFYTGENNVIIRAENTSGKVLDKTQCLQYSNTYKNKARTSSKPETKRGNLLISSAFKHAVNDIDWSQTA